MSVEKIGRLKPDESANNVRVIVDDIGEVGRITRAQLSQIISGVSPVMGSSDVGIGLLIGDVMISMYAWQVEVLLTKWPWKKAAVWRWVDD